MIVERTLTPDHQDLDFLTKMINQETTDFGVVDSVAFFVKNRENQIIAGCNCYVIFGAIHIDQLWVHPDHRKQGLGRSIMEKVHDYGRKLNCKMATVATMSFLVDARKFYEKLHYTSDFERHGYAEGASYIFFSKNL